jgi:glucose-6-phosphate isomerase
MAKTPLLSYDLNGLFAERIGEEGITQDEIDDLAPRLEKAHENVSALRREGKIGFFDLPYDDDLISQVELLAEDIAERFEHFVVIGIGGSALGNIALHTALNHPNYNELGKKARGRRPAMHFPDNIDPDRLAALLDVIDLRKTVFNFISKSGDTAEGMATFLWVRQLLINKLGAKKAKRHFIATTDLERGSLREIALKEGYPMLPVPANVGGRFSVFTAVGLLSAAVSGINIRALLRGAAEANRALSKSDYKKNPALAGAGAHYLLHTRKGKNIQIMMSYSHRLKDVADWFRQLWAESLGKQRDRSGNDVFVGQTPCKSVGVTDQHSQMQLYMEGPFDKVITLLTVDAFENTLKIPKSFPGVDSAGYLGGHTINELFHAEQFATELALAQKGRPVCAIRLPAVTPESVGALLMMLEAQTAYAGELYDINAFDQPGVELGKHFAYGILGRTGFEDKAREFKSAPKPDKTRIFSI